MKTPFDAASLLAFALLAIVYLHRSAAAARDPVPLWIYALAVLACAGGDVAANHGSPAIGAVSIAVSVVVTGWVVWKGDAASKPRA